MPTHDRTHHNHVHGGTPLNPLEVRDETDPELALVIRATRQYREQLLARDAWLPFPQNSCCYAFGPGKRPLPVGALFILWDHWPACTGECPRCGGEVYGYGFGGLLSIGGVVALCVDCNRRVSRPIGGLTRVGKDVSAWLEGTPYDVSAFRFGGCFAGDRRALVDALRRLGARDLPDGAWLIGSSPAGASFHLLR